MKTIDPIIDTDLDAYVDGELTVARRVEVEILPLGTPAIAAKVMADMSIRGELRMALAGEGLAAKAETREAARRLERGLAYGRVLSSFQRVAAVAILMAAGWVAPHPSAPSRRAKSTHPFERPLSSTTRCRPTGRRKCAAR